MKTYFLFGTAAVDFYLWGEETKEQKAHKFLKEYTYDPWDVYCYDSDKDNPKDLLNFYSGYLDHCVITEDFYNLLK